MDNVQDQGTTAAPAPGQAPAQSQTPSSDAQGGTVGTDAARTDGQSSAGQEGLLLGKFKSPEDLAKAYQELESHNKKVEMDRAELEKIFIGQAENPSTPQQAAPVQESENPLKPVADELAPLLRNEMGKVLSPVLARMEIESMVRKYGDSFVTVAAEVKAKQAQNSSLSLEDAYKLASFDRLQRTSKEQEASRVSQAQQAAQKAQVETSQPSGVRPVSIEEAASNPKIPMTEVLEAMGPEAEPFLARYREKVRPSQRR